ERGEAAHRADFFRGPLAQRSPVSFKRVAKDDEILHTSAEDRANNYPDGRGQIPKLRGQHRSDQRAGSCDRREMMAERDPSRGGNIVAAIREARRWSRMRVIKLEDLRGDKRGIETVAQRI